MDKVMFALKMTNRYGWDHECEYPTREAAQTALDKMRRGAEEQTEKMKEWLAIHPKPWDSETSTMTFISGYGSDKFPIENFNERGWYIAKIPATDRVYRLNTLPNDSVSLMEEIETKVGYFGGCTLGWTCTGHTRAEWQSEAAAEQLKKAHPEWEVTNTGYSVRIAA